MPLIPEYSKQTQLQVPAGDPQAQAPREQDIAGSDIITAGRELMQGADALKHIQHQQNNLWVAQAASRVAIAENKAYFESQNKAAPDAADFSKNHEADLRQRVQEEASNAPNPRAGQQFLQHIQPWITNRVDVAQHWEVATARFATGKGLDQASNDAASAVFTSDTPGRELAANNALAQQALAIDNSALTPEEKANAKHALMDRVSRAGVAADIRDRPAAAVDYILNRNSSASSPEGFLSTLRQTGTGRAEDFIEATRQAESGGKAIGSHGPGSSAYGAYGITKGWWDSVSKAHPELQLKPEDRFSDFKQHEAMQATVGDYTKALNDAGVKPSFTNLYMAHFLGTGGAVQFIKGVTGNPNIDARAYVSDAAAKANPGVFNGRTAGEVYQLYAHKFGVAEDGTGPQSSAPSYYKLLTAQERESLYQQAHAASQHKNTLAEAAFSQQAQDTMTKAVTLGVNAPLTQAQFVETYGAERGAALYNQYQTNHETALTSYKLNGLTPNEAGQLVESLKPTADTPGYDTRYKIWAGLADQHAKNMAAMAKDSPAYFTDAGRPQNQPVADAYKTMRENMTPQTAAAYAAVLDAAQARAGIPPNQRALISADYAADISRQVDTKLRTTEDPNVMQAVLAAHKNAWGNLWDRVYPALKDKLSPVAQVAMDAGIDPHVSQMLLGAADKSAEQLAKDTLPVDERKTLSDKTIGYFTELARSSGADVEGVKAVNTYAEQARKLAVMYRAQGMSVGDAAEKAYKALIGDRYEFRDNVRIPKAEYFDGIERELKDAKTRLPDIMRPGVTKNPFADNPAAGNPITEDFARQRTQTYAMRNGTWMTEPGNSGVVLILDGVPALRSDGAPVFFKWSSLREAQAARKAKAQDLETQSREAPLPPVN